MDECLNKQSVSLPTRVDPLTNLGISPDRAGVGAKPLPNTPIVLQASTVENLPTSLQQPPATPPHSQHLHAKMQHPLRHLARARPPLAPHAPPLTRPLSLPTILRPTFWSSLVPKPLRTPSSSSSSPTSPPPPRTRPRAPNPAIPYIIFSLLIGSQAIQTLWLKQERARRARRAEAHMEVLRGVIERVKEGGHVDVEGMLGVGVREEESRWWEGMFFSFFFLFFLSSSVSSFEGLLLMGAGSA